MASREYGSYDGMGLAELVRKKAGQRQGLLDEAIARFRLAAQLEHERPWKRKLPPVCA